MKKEIIMVEINVIMRIKIAIAKTIETVRAITLV